MLTVLLGGARCGKSALAVAIAQRSGRPVTFVATGEPLDAEFAERIDRHRAERPSSWRTIEAPTELDGALAQAGDRAVVIIDCLTLWVANLLGRELAEATIVERASQIAQLASARSSPVVVVSNEVGSGIVPADPLSRRYRDTLGRVNAAFAAHADEAFLVVAGRVVALSAWSGGLRFDGSDGSDGIGA
jgi:adenosylcobinamide kinase/adenosylcobinamide-phosphate guanylyltransferase